MRSISSRLPVSRVHPRGQYGLSSAALSSKAQQSTWRTWRRCIRKLPRTTLLADFNRLVHRRAIMRIRSLERPTQSRHAIAGAARRFKILVSVVRFRPGPPRIQKTPSHAGWRSCSVTKRQARIPLAQHSPSKRGICSRAPASNGYRRFYVRWYPGKTPTRCVLTRSEGDLYWFIVDGPKRRAGACRFS